MTEGPLLASRLLRLLRLGVRGRLGITRARGSCTTQQGGLLFLASAAYHPHECQHCKPSKRKAPVPTAHLAPDRMEVAASFGLAGFRELPAITAPQLGQVEESLAALKHPRKSNVPELGNIH